MPKGLYFTAVVSSFFLFLLSFFRRPISKVTLNGSQPNLGYVFTYDCYLKNLYKLPHGLGAKQQLFGTDFEI